MSCRETLRSASGLGGVSGRPRSMLIFPIRSISRYPCDSAARSGPAAQRAAGTPPREPAPEPGTGARRLRAHLPVSQDQLAITYGTPALPDARVTEPSRVVRAPSTPPGPRHPLAEV